MAESSLAGGDAAPNAGSSAWSVESVVSQLPSLQQPQQDTASSPVPFFHMLERLKTTKREGWRRFGITHGESISDHMYRMAIICMLCPPSLASRLDVARCTHMALVHDMAESLVGDITPVDRVPKAEKSRREASAMDYLTSRLLMGGSRANGGHAADAQTHPSRGDASSSALQDKDAEATATTTTPSPATAIRALWQEYEDAQTLESRFVHDVDKLELVLQLTEYERAHRVDLAEFTWRVQLPEVQAWVDDVVLERNRWRAKMGWPLTGGDGAVVE